MDDGSTQLRQWTRNDQGQVTSATDPLGRRTSYTYAANGLDLLEVRQTTGTLNDLLATYGSYTSGHLPQTVTDAAGQPTTLTYTAAGQVLTRTNALNETTTASRRGVPVGRCPSPLDDRRGAGSVLPTFPR